MRHLKTTAICCFTVLEAKKLWNQNIISRTTFPLKPVVESLLASCYCLVVCWQFLTYPSLQLHWLQSLPLSSHACSVRLYLNKSSSYKDISHIVSGTNSLQYDCTFTLLTKSVTTKFPNKFKIWASGRLGSQCTFFCREMENS